MYFRFRCFKPLYPVDDVQQWCASGIDLKFAHHCSVYHPECTKRLIIGIIWKVTEAYESHWLRADLRRQNGMVKRLFLFICILLILPSIIINNKDLLKTRLIFNFYAQISCKTLGIITYCWTLIPFYMRTYFGYPCHVCIRFSTNVFEK